MTLCPFLDDIALEKFDLPEAGARMYDPMSGGFLPDPFFHQSLLRSEQFHGQLVVGGLKKGLQLVLDETLFAGFRGAQRRGTGLLFRRAVQGHIVEVHLEHGKTKQYNDMFRKPLVQNLYKKIYLANRTIFFSQSQKKKMS